MSEAPERIWIQGRSAITGLWYSTEAHDHLVEYIRADLALTEKIRAEALEEAAKIAEAEGVASLNSQPVDLSIWRAIAAIRTTARETISSKAK